MCGGACIPWNACGGQGTNFVESVSCFYIGSGDESQVIGLLGQVLYPLNQLTGPPLFLFSVWASFNEFVFTILRNFITYLIFVTLGHKPGSEVVKKFSTEYLLKEVIC